MFTPEQAIKAKRRVEVKLYSVLDSPRCLYPRERDPVPTVQKNGWALGPVLTGADNLDPKVIRCWTVEPVASHHIATLCSLQLLVKCHELTFTEPTWFCV